MGEWCVWGEGELRSFVIIICRVSSPDSIFDIPCPCAVSIVSAAHRIVCIHITTASSFSLSRLVVIFAMGRYMERTSTNSLSAWDATVFFALASRAEVLKG